MYTVKEMCCVIHASIEKQKNLQNQNFRHQYQYNMSSHSFKLNVRVKTASHACIEIS